MLIICFFQSLMYRVVDNEPLRQFYHKGDLGKDDMRRLAAKWFIYLLLGASLGMDTVIVVHHCSNSIRLLGILAFAIRNTVEYLQDLKFDAVAKCKSIPKQVYLTVRHAKWTPHYCLLHSLGHQLCLCSQCIHHCLLLWGMPFLFFLIVIHSLPICSLWFQAVVFPKLKAT